MTFEKVLEELKPLNNVQPEIAEKIKSHNLPVIIYGAGEVAGVITGNLKNLGVEVSGYAVDAEYYKPNKTYLNKPLCNFAELSATPEKYVFVLGLHYAKIDKVRNFLNDKKLIFYCIMANYMQRMNYEYIFENREKFTETFNLFEDELSRKTMANVLKVRISENYRYNLDTYEPNTYFNDLTKPALQNRGGGRFVDCGAFIGDTVEKFINWYGDGYEKIFALEPDSANFETLKKFIQEKNYKNVEPLNLGVWNEKTTLTFSDGNGQGSSISIQGNIKVNVDTIDNIAGGERIDLIKMDIEGSELNALKGAAETIKKYSPVLAICAYHKHEDLITLPQFIKNLNPNYKFYLRNHKWYADVDYVLYAIP